MNIIDLTATIPAGNYTVGRRSKISQISEHHAVGDASGVITKARTVGIEFSCTFTIAMDGTVYQLVKEENTPYTDNDFNSNSRSITIEHAGGGNFPYTEAMYQASIELHRYLFGKYGNLNPVRHRDIPEIKADPSKATACPGQLDVERIIREAKGDDMYDGRTAEDWANQAKDAEQYKQQVVKSSAWTRGMGQKVGNVTFIINDLQKFKDDVIANPPKPPGAVSLKPGIYEVKA